MPRYLAVLWFLLAPALIAGVVTAFLYDVSYWSRAEFAFPYVTVETDALVGFYLPIYTLPASVLAGLASYLLIKNYALASTTMGVGKKLLNQMRKERRANARTNTDAKVPVLILSIATIGVAIGTVGLAKAILLIALLVMIFSIAALTPRRIFQIAFLVVALLGSTHVPGLISSAQMFLEQSV